MVSSYLERIAEAHRSAASQDQRDLDKLMERALGCEPTLPFIGTLSTATTNGLGLIAEIKRASPSKGLLAPDLVPEVMASLYAKEGASCISVLTDSEFFQGSGEDLVGVKSAVKLPVLRKDFTVCVADICDARVMGADAVLLIVAMLDETELELLLETSRTLGIDALVEVHSEDELHVALAYGAELIGVNRRNLATFEIDPNIAENLISFIPESVVAVAESGISKPEDAELLAKVGYDAILVGEVFITASDPATTIRAMHGHDICERT